MKRFMVAPVLLRKLARAVLTTALPVAHIAASTALAVEGVVLLPDGAPEAGGVVEVSRLDLFTFRDRGRARLRGVELETVVALPGPWSMEISAQRAWGEAEDGSPLAEVPVRSAIVQIRARAGPELSAAFPREARVEAGLKATPISFIRISFPFR